MREKEGRDEEHGKLRSDLQPPASGLQPPLDDIAKRNDVLSRIVLADLLEDDILGARPGDRAFALRLLLGEVGERLTTDTGFAFACGLNFYFRAPMHEEDLAKVGLEVSRLYYRFAAESALDPALVKEASPLLANLLSNLLTRLRLESVDHARIFDGTLHEREPTSDAQNAKIVRPSTFLCRVAKTNMVRVKAEVCT